jgi:hypothetical protein
MFWWTSRSQPLYSSHLQDDFSLERSPKLPDFKKNPFFRRYLTFSYYSLFLIDLERSGHGQINEYNVISEAFEFVENGRFGLVDCVDHGEWTKMKYDMEKREDFALKVVGLALWHAANTSDSPDEFINTVSKRTPIYRLTDFWDAVTVPWSSGFDAEANGWSVISENLKTIYKNASCPGEVENEGLKLLRPHLESRVVDDCARFPWLPCGYVPYKLPNENVFGIFAYEVPDDEGDIVDYHIANSLMPDSPFRDMNARKCELMEMITSIKQRTKAIRLACESWLNAFPPFLKLFPDSYPEKNAAPPALSPGYNWWGQFMSRDGGFNEKNGQVLRSTGKFPFVPCRGECGIDELLEHLYLLQEI